ncbi:DUF3575 domain-containing protein [Hymenobacter sp. BT635]|uniref:DUF3575 domain-containing protein n=1 Tax=Hymenobacter nitidus TaxID=2880929 RepID=A0ABS8ADA7_9BACT|nr:DUF3575 domain-containing protein [Hymenobacter nitidus]MCB2378383.1 DUF3575 domain-containing protein [Hymenobacter nitidus]
MKKLLLAAAIVAGSSSSALAQSNVVKVNIISPLVKTGSFFFEHKLNDNSSVQLGALVTSWKIEDTRFSGFAITPEYRFYLSEKNPAPNGFYVGPFLRYQNLTVTDKFTYGDTNGSMQTEEVEAKLNTIGGGVVVGRQWIFKERFALDIFLGPSYNTGDLKVQTTGTDPETFDADTFLGFGIRTGITFGIAF